jgi:hypothetical protein
MAGVQLPVIAFVELVGNATNVPPAQIGEIGLKVGVIVGFTTKIPLTFEVPFQNPPPPEL